MNYLCVDDAFRFVVCIITLYYFLRNMLCKRSLCCRKELLVFVKTALRCATIAFFF